jgi:hypothetical protein
MGRDDGPELETRAVRVQDPSLSEAANRALTDELREVVGADEVQVPKSTPHRERDVRGTQVGLRGVMGRNRLLITIVGVCALVVGAIVALAVRQWWVLFIPVGVHAIGTLVVGFMIVQMTTQPESPDPSLSVQLEAEGVEEPERAFNELVEEFTGATGAGGATEVVTTGNGSNQGIAGEDPARAAAQQRTAMTPAEGATEPAGDESFSALGQMWVIVGGLVLLSLVGGFVVDGGWLLPVVMIPFCAAWVVYELLAMRGADSGGAQPPGDHRTAKRRMTLIVAGSLLAIELVTLIAVVLGSRSS